MGATLKIDPEFKSLIPPLARKELQQLEANLLAEGCRDPLVVWNGILADGHNRYEICSRHGIDYKTVAIELPDKTSVKLWIIDNQFGRRNLSDIDQIKLKELRRKILEPIANKNKQESLPKPGQKGFQNVSSKLDTHKQSAEELGMGKTTYLAGKLILEAAENGEIDQEEVEAVRRKEKSIHRVAKEIKETRQKNQREEKRQEAARVIKLPSNIIVGDFRQHQDKIADNSLSLIFTDPPYDQKAIELFDGLGQFAAKKLCEGGSLLCYLGHLQLMPAMNALSMHLRYWWTVCCLHSGPNSLMREYGIRVCWKPVLWFVKTTRHDPSNIVNDVMSGGREKDHHDWQQAQSEAEYWIEKLCPQDGLVCDPFLGGGTTGAAAKKLGRKWIGFEIDEAKAKIAGTRK